MATTFGKFAAALLAATALFAASDALADPAVSISLDTPKPHNTSKDSNKRSGSSRRRNYTNTETIDRRMEYTGTVRCVIPTNETAEVEIEAFFVKSAIVKGVMKPTITPATRVGSFTFGGSLPSSGKFSFVSPTFTQKVVTKQNRSRWRNRSETKSSGTKLLGVIVRAQVNGRTVFVTSSPRNSDWDRAGKLPTPTFERQ